MERTEERRKEPRQRTILGAKVTFNHRRSVFDCVVRNMATSGAMLQFGGSAPIPDAVDLHITNREQSFRADVIWRDHDRAGVALSEFQRKEAPLNLDAVRRERAMRRQIRALRKRLDYSG